MVNNLNIVVLWLYDFDGSKIFNTGLQRWCRDVALLAKEKGYKITIYQKATKHFKIEMSPGVKVIGIRCALSFRGNKSVSRWLDCNADPTEPFIFVSKEMYCSKKLLRTVGVDHGIWWDGDYPGYRKWINKRFQYRLVRSMRGIICVDTNYINWCHAELPNRVEWEGNLTYIPNYADEKRFGLSKQTQDSSSEDGLLTILFPRRACGENLDRHIRGAGLLTKAVDILEQRGVRTRVLFVGEGGLQGALKRWAIKQNMVDRVEIFSAAMDQMPSVYVRADVVVVPTLAREGTSLSAVEALISGKPTVVTHIGGLGNIVIPGFNGYVCDLTPESLANSILEAYRANPLSNVSVLEACRNSLGKKRWDRQVWSYIERKLEL